MGRLRRGIIAAWHRMASHGMAWRRMTSGVQRAEHLVRGGAGAECQGPQGGSRGLPSIALGEKQKRRWLVSLVVTRLGCVDSR